MVSCWEAIATVPQLLDGLEDNCEPYPAFSDIISEIWYDYGCDSADVIGRIERNVIAYDVWGNTKYCTQEITIARDSIDGAFIDPDQVEITCDFIERGLITRISNDLGISSSAAEALPRQLLSAL